jgi:hypothetical protein
MTIVKIFSNRHIEDLVAINTPCFIVGLECDHLAVEAPVGFGIVGAKG